MKRFLLATKLRQFTLAALLIVTVLATHAFAAIDSEDKRRSMAGYPGLYRALPVADGTIDSGDRAHLAFEYRGNYEGITAGGSGLLKRSIKKWLGHNASW